MGTRSFPE